MMEHEGFLRRWSRLKDGAASAGHAAEAGTRTETARDAAAFAAPADSREAPGATAADAGPAASPTLDDAMRLTPESDYARFMAQGVDPLVRRLALKKLFSDPHFRQMDGLDIYIGDYSRAAPLPAAMRAALRQARSFLDDSAAAAAAGTGHSADDARPDGHDGPPGTPEQQGARA